VEDECAGRHLLFTEKIYFRNAFLDNRSAFFSFANRGELARQIDR
jgi:hypothetical protein